MPRPTCAIERVRALSLRSPTMRAQPAILRAGSFSALQSAWSLRLAPRAGAASPMIRQATVNRIPSVRAIMLADLVLLGSILICRLFRLPGSSRSAIRGPNQNGRPAHIPEKWIPIFREGYASTQKYRAYRSGYALTARPCCGRRGAPARSCLLRGGRGRRGDDRAPILELGFL